MSDRTVADPPMNAEDALELLFPDLSILPIAERLRLSGGSRIRGTMAGKRRSVSLGGSQEFADFRPYSPGDDIRRIDWNVFGRTGRAYVRQYWDEQELYAHLYVDVSRSMTFTGGASCSKLQYALRLSALVGYAGLAGEDRVAVKLFDDTNVKDELPLLFGRSSFMKLYTYMARYYAASGATIPEYNSNNGSEKASLDLSRPFRAPGALPRRSGVTWLFTDAMFEAGMEETLLALKAAGQQIVVVQLLSPEELSPRLVGELKLVDSELGTGKEVAVSHRLLKEYRAAVDAYREELGQRCAEKGAAYVFVDTSRSMQDAFQAIMAVPGTLSR